MSGKGEQQRWRTRHSSRRLITLIFEGRNLMKIIRRELPLNRCVGLVPPVLVARSETHCIKGTRVLRFVAPSTATSAARSVNISLVDSVADLTASISSCSYSVVRSFVFGVVFGFSSDADLPNEAEQLTTDRRDYLRFVLSRREQCSITGLQTMLRLPGDLSDFSRGVSLSLQQPAAEPGSELISPGSFHQNMSQVSVASFGDAALITMAATRVFTGNKTAVTHQLFGATETKI